MRVIRQNILVFAFGLNALAIVLAALRLLGPVAAAITHQIGSLLVLLNALRLLGFDRWSEHPAVKAAGRVFDTCRRCRPSSISSWAWRHQRGLIRAGVVAALLAYLGSGITLIGPSEVGLLKRWGKYRPPVLGPGLHVRLPAPFESVMKVEPDLVRVARIGPASASASTAMATATSNGGPGGITVDRNAIAWNASHGARRDEAALFFTGDENLVELAGVVEYRYTAPNVAELVFGTSAVEPAVASASEGVFREVVGRTALEDLLVADRRGVESDVKSRLQARLDASGPRVQVERVRIVDAHPPREVVPAYRDAAAAVSDAERYRNEASAYAAEQHWSARAEAQGRRDYAATIASQLQARARGDQLAFLARVSAHTAQPDLTEFRLLWDTLGLAFADRPKLILDPRAGGRRQVWLADPDRLGISAAAARPAGQSGRPRA